LVVADPYLRDPTKLRRPAGTDEILPELPPLMSCEQDVSDELDSSVARDPVQNIRERRCQEILLRRPGGPWAIPE
jgi:hypothetical protein